MMQARFLLTLPQHVPRAALHSVLVWHGTPCAPHCPVPPAPCLRCAGIRNAAGFQFHPASGDLLFSGMERDYMGDNSVGAIDASHAVCSVLLEPRRAPCVCAAAAAVRRRCAAAAVGISSRHVAPMCFSNWVNQPAPLCACFPFCSQMMCLRL